MSWLREPDTEPIPGYRLIEPLGAGGFGEVWKCVAPGGIHKAMKFVFGNLNTIDSDSAKAEQEFKAIERVKAVRHPFVLSMDQIQIVKGELLIVMELADKSLFDLLEENTKSGRTGIPREQLIGFMADAAEGLDHLIEKHSLLHLDVKPKNLFLISDRVKVADFGLVSCIERNSAAGMMAGITPVYTSPETFQNKISKQSDQYSLAIVYTELLTGKRPFNGKNIRQLALQHMTQPPDLSCLPETDRAAVARALAKNPEDRYPTCLAFIRALIAGSMTDEATTKSLYNTSVGLRHVVTSHAEIQLPEMPKPSAIAATPAPLFPAAAYPTPTPATGPPKPKSVVSTPSPPLTKSPAFPKTSSPITSTPSAIITPGVRSSIPGGAIPGLVNPRAAATARTTPPPRMPDVFDPMTQPIPGRPGSAVRRNDSSSIMRTTASRPVAGVLRPMLLVGVGSFGRKALQQIRARLLDRLGNLNQVPCIRFLCLDSEPVGSPRGPIGSPDVELANDHVLNMPLQQTSNYRRRQLDQILEWLPKERFYAIPRSLTVDGNRAIGRLAFSDHALRAYSRIKGELQTACHPDSLAASSDFTGLTVLTRTPAIHVFASASGGTGGMLIDVGYCIRRALDKSDAARSPITSFVFAGAPQDVNTPAAEQSNILATLVELNHYSEPDVLFTAQYGGQDGPKVEEPGRPFTCTYLITMQERSKAAFDDCLANLAGYVTHDLTTPLGATLEQSRRTDPIVGRTPFRQFGTFGLWYPRGLVVRNAARQLCADLVREWANPAPAVMPGDVQTVVDRLLNDVRLSPAEVKAGVNRDATRRKTDIGSPVDIVQEWLKNLVLEADNDQPQPGNWVKAIMSQAKEFVGIVPTDETSSKFSRGKLSITLDRGVSRLAEQWSNELTESIRPLLELPGVGLSAGEYALQNFVAACKATTVELDGKLRESAGKRTSLFAAVQSLADGFESTGSSLSLFAGRTTRNRKAFAEKFKQFVDLRIDEDLTVAAIRFYTKLVDRLSNQLQDLALCRQQMSDLYRELAAPHTSAEMHPNAALSDDAVAVQSTLQMTNTIRVVLPNGEERIDRAAGEMVASLTVADRIRLDQVLHKLVLEPRGGILGLSKSVANTPKHLAPALIDQTAAFLAEQLPAEDVTAIEAAATRNRPDGGVKRMEGYVRAAAAHVTASASDAMLYVTVPDSESGRQYGNTVAATYPGAQAIVIPNHCSDLLFCREQDWLRQSDLRDLVSTCWDAYATACETVESSPHVRFDVPHWMPLIGEAVTQW
jgi:serine/threonine protein kinase